MKLNRLVGLPINTAPDVADSLYVVNWIRSDENLTEKALKQRPEMNMLENTVSMNEFNEKITASRYNPQLGVGMGGNSEAPSPGLSTDPAFNYNLHAKLAIPIFYWGKKKEEVFAIHQMTEISNLNWKKQRI